MASGKESRVNHRQLAGLTELAVIMTCVHVVLLIFHVRAQVEAGQKVKRVEYSSL